MDYGRTLYKYCRRRRTPLAPSLVAKNYSWIPLGKNPLKTTKLRHWISKDPVSVGVICNLEWIYDDGSVSRVSQHIPDYRIKENERRNLAMTWRRLRKWRYKETTYAKDLKSLDQDTRLYWPVSVN